MQTCLKDKRTWGNLLRSKVSLQTTNLMSDTGDRMGDSQNEEHAATNHAPLTLADSTRPPHVQHFLKKGCVYRQNTIYFTQTELHI